MNTALQIPQTEGDRLNTLSQIFDISSADLTTIVVTPRTDLTKIFVKFAPNVAQWRYAISYMWADQLRDAETLPVIGESLQAGDLVVAAGTRTLYKLLEPLETTRPFGRTLTAWRVLSLNTPAQAERVEPFFHQQTYKVLPKAE